MLDLADFVRAQKLDAEIVSPGVPMPTVDAAAAVLQVPPERIFKSILFVARDGRCVMGIASGKTRVDAKRLASLTATEGLRLASPELALRVTGYPAGGTPPVGHRERFPVVVDTRVVAQEWGWAGGGREALMVRIRSADIVRLTGAQVGDIVEGAAERDVADLNPHREQMADESMVRTLAAQAKAIWPQEVELIRRYGLGPDIRILDAGCGTGEASSRLAGMFPNARVLGVDILDEHLAAARERYAGLASRLSFDHQSIYELRADRGTFDLTVCRHVVHSIPHAGRVLAELVRVTRPGGRLHLIPEDYGMLHFQAGKVDPRVFWHEAPTRFGEATGTDLFVGRNSYSLLVDLGVTDITVDYVIVDTLRVPRETFASIIEAWRDGYVERIGEITRFSRAEAAAYFDQMIADIRHPNRYAVWMVPVVAGKTPAAG